MVVLDQPHQLEFFKLAQVVGRLQIEVNTGLKFRSPTLKAARKYYNLKVLKKAQALEILEKAKNEALLHPTQIWVILAKVRGAVVFIACDCGWQGDEFTVGAFCGGNYCPKCKMDESGMTFTPIEEVVTLA